MGKSLSGKNFLAAQKKNQQQMHSNCLKKGNPKTTGAIDNLVGKKRQRKL